MIYNQVLNKIIPQGQFIEPLIPKHYILMNLKKITNIIGMNV